MDSIIAYYDPEGRKKLYISITTIPKLLKKMKKKHSYYDISLKEIFVEHCLSSPWDSRCRDNKYVISYYIFPIKDIYVYSTELTRIKNKINLFENLLKYNDMLYCRGLGCKSCTIVIYNDLYNCRTDIYKKMMRKINITIYMVMNYSYNYQNEKISISENVLQRNKDILQRNKDFHKRLDYLIDHS